MASTAQFVKYFGVFSLSVYCFWNIYFLSNAKIPPSIFYKLTGIPCPTTGMYRSLMGIIDSDYNTFINNNPIVIIFLPLVMVILGIIMIKLFKNEKVYIPKYVGNTIFLSLIISELVAVKNFLL